MSRPVRSDAQIPAGVPELRLAEGTYRESCGSHPTGFEGWAICTHSPSAVEGLSRCQVGNDTVCCAITFVSGGFESPGAGMQPWCRHRGKVHPEEASPVSH